jgi:GntR family transcriptional regulator, transcriptional repressor for pyruvate dehydrogenase complex
VKTSTVPADRLLLSKSVEQALAQAISQRRFVTGEKLPTELELCKQFGVSRTVIREAVTSLQAKGLIAVRKGKGIFVKELTGASVADPLHFYLQMNFARSAVLDLVRARRMIEPEIAALAAVNRTPEDLARLKEDLARLGECADDHSALARFDTQFHVDIARATGNPLLPVLMEPIHRMMPEVKSSVYAAIADAKQSARTLHQRIFRAIVAGKPEAARQEMVRHLQTAERHCESMLRTRETAEGSNTTTTSSS